MISMYDSLSFCKKEKFNNPRKHCIFPLFSPPDLKRGFPAIFICVAGYFCLQFVPFQFIVIKLYLPKLRQAKNKLLWWFERDWFREQECEAWNESCNIDKNWWRQAKQKSNCTTLFFLFKVFFFSNLNSKLFNSSLC